MRGENNICSVYSGLHNKPFTGINPFYSIYHTYFTDEEIEAWQGEVTYPGLHW